MYRVASIVVLFVSFFAVNSAQQAPGDEDDLCLLVSYRPSVVNQEILMWSFNYRNLLENQGARWLVLDEDSNNDGSSTTVSGSHLFNSSTVRQCEGSATPKILYKIVQFLGHSNWIISFPLLDVTTSMRVGGLLLSYYSPDI